MRLIWSTFFCFAPNSLHDFQNTVYELTVALSSTNATKIAMLKEETILEKGKLTLQNYVLQHNYLNLTCVEKNSEVEGETIPKPAGADTSKLHLAKLQPCDQCLYKINSLLLTYSKYCCFE